MEQRSPGGLASAGAAGIWDAAWSAALFPASWSQTGHLPLSPGPLRCPAGRVIARECNRLNSSRAPKPGRREFPCHTGPGTEGPPWRLSARGTR